jgi:trehalose 6-phosphate phosphatase
LILFLDFDGTIAPIAERPEGARLKASVRRLLSRLARSVPVVIVSGRALSDLRRRVGLSGVWYVAYHGLAFKEPGAPVRWLGRRVSRQTVRRWVSALESAAKGITGALIEDKGMNVALHDRLVRPTERALLRRRALRVLDPWLATERITLVRGKRVLEVVPSGGVNKGTAVGALLRQRWSYGRTPVYIGDDRTDFDAFEVVRERGLAILVGGRRRAAETDAWVPNTQAVETLLRWLSARVETLRRMGGTAFVGAVLPAEMPRAAHVDLFP